MTNKKFQLKKQNPIIKEQNLKHFYLKFENWLLEHVLSFSRSGFTLIEIMLVIVIIGIVAGFTIPNYSKSVARAYMRDAKNNLIIIREANQVYRAQEGTYWPTTAGNLLSAINTNLRLNILANGSNYTCSGVAGGATFSCTATRGNTATITGYSETVNQNAIAIPPNSACTLGCLSATPCNPCCDGGAC